MKNTFLWLIAAFAVIYFIKKGQESAENEGETLTFFETIKRGFKLTVQSLGSPGNDTASKETTAQNSQYVDDRPSNEYMVNFSAPGNSFQNAALKNNEDYFTGLQCNLQINKTKVSHYG